MKRIMQNLAVSRLNRYFAVLLTLAIAMLMGTAGATGTDVSDITSAASTTFTAVAGICVTIAVFFIGLKIAKRVTRG